MSWLAMMAAFAMFVLMGGRAAIPTEVAANALSTSPSCVPRAIAAAISAVTIPPALLATAMEVHVLARGWSDARMGIGIV